MSRPYIPQLRRISEAVASRLAYDFLCHKGALFDEAYLSHGVADVLSACSSPSVIKIKKGFKHSVLADQRQGSGRKPEIDYVAFNIESKEIELAVETKWAGSSHCTVENMLLDVVRLQILKAEFPKAECGLLLAGHAPDIDKLFVSSFRNGNVLGIFHKFQKIRRTKFSKQSLEDARETWDRKHPSITPPEHLITTFINGSISANPLNRFKVCCWRVG